MSDKTGGPAFPVIPWTREDNEAHASDGMSMRDYFAAAVVPSAIRALMDAGSAEGATKRAARIAYEVADAMLAEREKQS